MWWRDGFWHVPWFFGPFFMILMFAFCAVMMFFMMRPMMGGHGGRSTALVILKERFARGEITQMQYEEQRRTLKA